MDSGTHSTEAGGALRLPVIPNVLLNRLLGLNWGQVVGVGGSIPTWVEAIPAEFHKDLLGSEAVFQKREERNQPIINSGETLLKEPEVTEGTYVAPDHRWYVLLCPVSRDEDKEVEAVLLDGPFDYHQGWIEQLTSVYPEIRAFAVPKHPAQLPDGAFNGRVRRP